MILRSQPIWQTESWQQQLANAISDPVELMRLLELDPAQSPFTGGAMEEFPLRVPHAFAARMRPGDWRDPLLLQILPDRQELLPQPGFIEDPLAEADANPVPGLIHKYQGRVLWVASPACAVHCRYCFRRHFPYADNTPARDERQQALDYIASDPSIREVILSGGDPLAASDRYLSGLVQAIAGIPHVQRLRLHTRLPIVLPARINTDCLDWLTAHPLQVVVVLHCNHYREIDASVTTAIQAMRQRDITVLNQTVLLKGINDCPSVLAELSETLFAAGVIPYYLHTLDPVKGAAHFHMTDEQAMQIYTALLQRLPGFLVPRLVREQPGAGSKLPMAPSLL